MASIGKSENRRPSDPKSHPIWFIGLATLVVAGCGFLPPAQAQVLRLGSCPQPSVVSNFNVSQYAGTWYENRKYFAIFELGQKCVTATYTANSDSTVTVYNKGKQIITGRTVTVTGTARQLSSPSGKLGVTFSSVPFSPTDAPYWVLGTDYTSYAVVFSCSALGPINAQIAWILTRAQSPDSSVVNTALGVLDSSGISRTPLKTTSQSNC